MNNHITSAEWAEYQSGKGLSMDRLQLIARVHAHIGSCEKCKALHRQYVQFRNRLDEVYEAEEVAVIPAAYRAVAAGSMEAGGEELGVLTIDLECAASGGLFLYDSMEVSGDCEKYAFGPEARASRLVDECDEGTWMEIAGGVLRLSFPETPEVAVSAVIYDEDNNVFELDVDENGCAEFNLAADASYTLEIVLSEVDG